MMGRTGKHLHELFGEAKTGNCVLQSRVAFVGENRGYIDAASHLSQMLRPALTGKEV